MNISVLDFLSTVLLAISTGAIAITEILFRLQRQYLSIDYILYI